MKFPLGTFVVSAFAVASVWWWLGLPVAMPPSPLPPDGKLQCLSYAPFRGQQNPLVSTTRIEPWQIEEDLARLSRLTNCVRTYSVEHGLDRVPEIARRHGLKVLHGIWLSGNATKERVEIDTSVELIKQFPDTIQAVVVGNEVLLRGEYSGATLARIIRDVKARISVPVTYADVWEFWLRHPEVYAAVDFVTIHILPYWEDFPIPAREAASHIASIRKKVAADFPGKEILIGETGWPSAGRMREGALPSPANQARVIQEVLEVARRENYRVNLIEAYDQPWKRALEGTVGGHWGIFDAARREPKFEWGIAVSNHPLWRWHAIGGILFAGVVVGVATLAIRRGESPETSNWLWAGIAANAVAGGILTPWAITNLPIESLGFGGWLRSLAFATLALLAPLAGSAALTRTMPVPAFAQVLGRLEDRPRDRLALMIGALLILAAILAVQSALGLVFNPRYLDFPFAPLTAGTVPFLVLTLLLPRSAGKRAATEISIAGVLALSGAYIAFNESFVNWQALWFVAALAALAVILFRARDARG